MAGWFSRKMEEEKILMSNNEVASGSYYRLNMSMVATISLERLNSTLLLQNRQHLGDLTQFVLLKSISTALEAFKSGKFFSIPLLPKPVQFLALY